MSSSSCDGWERWEVLDDEGVHALLHFFVMMFPACCRGCAGLGKEGALLELMVGVWWSRPALSNEAVFNVIMSLPQASLANQT